MAAAKRTVVLCAASVALCVVGLVLRQRGHFVAGLAVSLAGGALMAYEHFAGDDHAE